MARPVLGSHSLTLDHAPTATGTRLLGAASVPGHGVPTLHAYLESIYG